jgi:hypothetical protein
MSQHQQQQKKVAGEAPAPPVFQLPSAPAQPRQFGTESINTEFNFTTPNDEHSKQAVCRMRRFAFSS